MNASRPGAPWHSTPPPSRDYFALLGDGVVAIAPPRRPGEGGNGWSPPTGGGWLHVAPSGRVTAFTGKVDVGQGTREALCLLVAEELDTLPDRVTVVVGDTDVCPWDMGTFGSRSMPDAAPALRAAAAAAGACLAELAREPPAQMRNEDGGRGPGAVEGSAGRTFPFLVGRRVLTTAAPEQRLSEPRRWKRAGRPFVAPSGREVVTGARRYGSDLFVPNLGYGAVLRPPRYGDRLVDVDASQLRSQAEIHVVSEPGFFGVVAPSPARARSALLEVRAVWEGASQPAESDVESYLRGHPATEDAWDVDQQASGDPTSAYDAARIRVEATYRTAFIAHVPLECRSALAEWSGGRLTVWVGTQTPFRAAEFVAGKLGMPPSDVRIVCPPTGSGFGGKHGGAVALDAARLARSAGRPVRVDFSREEEFRYGYLRPMAVIDVRASLDDDGALSSWTFRNFNAGAAALATPYRVANVRVDNVLCRSPLPQGSYRALAATANTFAREVAMDELATLRGEDPVVFRRRQLEDPRLRAVLERAAELSGWAEFRAAPGRGHGIALSREKGGRVATVAEVRVDAAGSLTVDRLLTAFEAGAIVHPEGLASQVEGATIMGLGGALFESVHFDPGRLATASLASYRVPRFSDVPKVEVALIDRPDLPSAGGGETPLIAVAPALANAVHSAVGVRLRSLPLLVDGRIPRTSPG